MRATRFVIVTTAALLAPASAAYAQSFGGQSALQKLEDKIGGSPGASAAATDAAPGSGYLGGEFDDPKEGQKGVLVINVRPRGPAEMGGLKSNDLITAIDGKAVAGLNDLDGVLDKAIVGQRLRMTVNRVGRTENLTVTLGTRPPAAAPAESNLGEPAPGGATTAPGPALPFSTTPAPGAAPPVAPSVLPSPSTPRSPALGSPAPALGSPTPALGGASPAGDRPESGGTFAPRSSATPPGGSSSPATTPPSDPGTGIRARPLDLGSSPESPAPLDTAPIAPADPPPGPSAAGSATSGGPALGITVDVLTDDVRQANSLPVRRGALITAVRPGSPADRAGLPVGGLVVRLDGRPINSADDLVAAIRAARPGQEIELGYYEGSDFQRKSVTLGPAAASPAPGSLPRLSGGALAERPLIGRVERMVDGFARGGGSNLSTVYDPSVIADLQRQVTELSATVRSLEDRLRALEGGRGAPASPLPAAPTVTPGFGSAPIGPATPGFVPGLTPPATTP